MPPGPPMPGYASGHLYTVVFAVKECYELGTKLGWICASDWKNASELLYIGSEGNGPKRSIDKTDQKKFQKIPC